MFRLLLNIIPKPHVKDSGCACVMCVKNLFSNHLKVQASTF